MAKFFAPSFQFVLSKATGFRQRSMVFPLWWSSSSKPELDVKSFWSGEEAEEGELHCAKNLSCVASCKIIYRRCVRVQTFKMLLQDCIAVAKFVTDFQNLPLYLLGTCMFYRWVGTYAGKHNGYSKMPWEVFERWRSVWCTCWNVDLLRDNLDSSSCLAGKHIGWHWISPSWPN